jgi:Domain of unknown function (DUF4965)/Domain of unknown function (DUF5127)/Domain of unknown function (DUF1793)/Domain of unknown function (DUF4964)
MADGSGFRPPAVPLATLDPYLSIWSEATRLTDDTTRHWTHHEQPLVGLIRIDGKAYRIMGPDPKTIPAFPQVGLQVTPTRSIYDFQNELIHLTMTFTTPALPNDLNVLTRPVTYITWDVKSVDHQPHTVSIYNSVSSALVVNEPSQKVQWSRETMGALTAMKIGTKDQTLLTPSGDDTRIDWGYAYSVAATAQSVSAAGPNDSLIKGFVDGGTLPTEDDKNMPRAVKDDQPVLATVLDLGSVGDDLVSRHLMIGYDEIFAIKLSGHKLRPYWRRDGAQPADLFQAAENDYAALMGRCQKFDEDLMADMTKVGGDKYAQMCALAYRQCLAGTGIAADANKQPLLFTKENGSDGNVATVDVIFPMAPMFVFLSPTLAKAAVVPVLVYASSERWKFPNAPHDLGASYPIASVTGDAGEAMPVEESGNMLILCDAIAKVDGNASFVDPYWKQLTQWAKYLEQYGLDPEDQLCSDDFMGHLAHNSNLSIKAILALAAYGDLCQMRGDQGNADKYMDMAKTDAAHWVKVAEEGDHSVLAFDKPNTWSQKYNLVWDKILGLNIFPDTVARKEIDYYKMKMNQYGLPLDSRTKRTKTDWTFWSATLADNPKDFQLFMSPVYDYLNQTSARLPLSDLYTTDDVHSAEFRARPVVGGLFVKMLTDPQIWKKWTGMDKNQAGPWAPLPAAVPVDYIFPPTAAEPMTWKFTTDRPADGWNQTNFDDSAWKEAPGGFGNDIGPYHSPWKTSDIWLRKVITLPDKDYSHAVFMVFHDEDVEIYVNGIPAAKEPGFVSEVESMSIGDEALALFKPNAEITLAVHCHQTVNGQCIDVRIANDPDLISP